MRRSGTASVFDYLNYRLYLSYYYETHKSTERGFSHRVMASRLGFTSPNFLKLVMDGERNISHESLVKITRGLRLNKKESEYFSYLVFFAQAKKPVEKNYYFGLIAGSRTRTNVAALTHENFEYFSEWYHPAVREMVAGKTDPLDYESLSRGILGGVSAARIRKSVELLLQLKLIAVNDAGVYTLSSPLLNTENELKSFAIRRYHGEVLGVARQALDTVPPEQREYSQLTVRISPDGFRKIKERIQALRGEFLQTVSDDRDAGGVYHLNMQLYPIATNNEGETVHA